MARSWRRHQWRCQTAVLVVAVGTAALRPIKGYNGCFDKDGALLRQVDKNGRPLPDLFLHVASGQPVFSQQRNELKHPLSYYKSEYGRRPKYLFHWTAKKYAKIIADDECIEQTEASGGDAYLGQGVYMTAIPGWADPEVVRRNNYGLKGKQFDRWNSANAYVQVDYAAVYESRLNMKIKAGWQSNFCIRVPKGKLFLSRGIGAVICWDMTWDHKKKEWIEHSQFFDWEA